MATFFHFDIEVSASKGECKHEEGGAIVQLSCLHIPRVSQDPLRVEFDEHVMPHHGAAWNEIGSAASHGMTAGDFATGGKHALARPLKTAFAAWSSWRAELMAEHGTPGKPRTGGLLCWGGNACEATWLHRVTEPGRGAGCKMPIGMDCFWDPLQAIRHCEGCNCNQHKCCLDSLGLSSVHAWPCGARTRT